MSSTETTYTAGNGIEYTVRMFLDGGFEVTHHEGIYTRRSLCFGRICGNSLEGSYSRWSGDVDPMGKLAAAILAAVRAHHRLTVDWWYGGKGIQDHGWRVHRGGRLLATFQTLEEALGRYPFAQPLAP